VPTRRDVLLQTMLAGASAAWLATPALAGADPALRDSRALMGTRVDMSLDGAPVARLEAARDAAWAEMTRLATMMSRYIPGNPLDRLVAVAGREPASVPREMFDILRAGRQISILTGGAFDMSVGALGWRFDTPQQPVLPSKAQIDAELIFVNYRDLILNDCECSAWLRRPGMKLDLGGIAKLPILAAGMAVLERHGVPRAMLNGGGDVLVRSHGTDARPWRIGIRDAAAPEKLLAVLPLRDGVVASSGDYERGVTLAGRRYHHVLDPATGYPTEQVRGVTLLADTVDTVNGLGTAAMVLGPQRGAALLAGSPARQAMLVRADGGLWATPALAARLEPPPGSRRVRGLDA
jgi:thiamine biosynthesis lipoprotein